MEVENGLAIVKDEKGNINIVENYQNLEKIEELKYKVNYLEEILTDTKKAKKDFIYEQIGNMVVIGASTLVTLVGINSITESQTASLLSAGLVVCPFTLFLALQVYNEYNSKKHEFKFRIKYDEDVLIKNNI